MDLTIECAMAGNRPPSLGHSIGTFTSVPYLVISSKFRRIGRAEPGLGGGVGMSGFSSSGMANRARETTPTNVPDDTHLARSRKDTLGHASPAGSAPRNAPKVCLPPTRKCDRRNRMQRT